MDRSEFDQYADEYLAQHQANIAVTGENPEFFARYKIALTRQFADAARLAVRRTLDFGSGIGASVPWFRHYFDGAELTCADASPRSLALSQSRFPGGGERYLEVDGDALPLDDASVDLGFSACVFHHIGHDEHVGWLRELRRVIAPDGRLVIFEHNPYNPLTVRAVNTCPFDANARLITARKLAAAMVAAGWKTVETRYHLFFPHALAALRPVEPALAWLPLGGQYSLVASR
ncbi:MULTISPECIES: class I SAM-dependent methyltransferase [Sphingosinicellaceae]|uniref:class I SAM-dependent methyltransferase n=1 Tax=Sphingosinicellaceae TaxID=2820280 RepID=UPI001C1E3E17|nr:MULTISPECIES: class I SAM-dependent methyltransferase [Polymorphobacter]QYE34623.1 class I SAM-dependent methyltransferase [Polymorphobacter sp. PAMC 29334]UAJ09807.1 class I SAM-dependent methyltransferase [Polymorphobacter megasporae]